MEVNELRIGNLIYDSSNKIIKVSEIEAEGVNAFYDTGIGGTSYEFGGRIEGLKPIPLTEKWLLDFGAEKFDAGFIQNRFRLLYKSLYNYWYVIDKETNAYFSKVEFVHEWQNLFFAMNGTELKQTT